MSCCYLLLYGLSDVISWYFPVINTLGNPGFLFFPHLWTPLNERNPSAPTDSGIVEPTNCLIHTYWVKVTRRYKILSYIRYKVPFFKIYRVGYYHLRSQVWPTISLLRLDFIENQIFLRSTRFFPCFSLPLYFYPSLKVFVPFWGNTRGIEGLADGLLPLALLSPLALLPFVLKLLVPFFPPHFLRLLSFVPLCSGRALHPLPLCSQPFWQVQFAKGIVKNRPILCVYRPYREKASGFPFFLKLCHLLFRGAIKER